MNSRHDGRKERREEEEEEEKRRRVSGGAGSSTEEAMRQWGCELSIESCSDNNNNHVEDSYLRISEWKYAQTRP